MPFTRHKGLYMMPSFQTETDDIHLKAQPQPFGVFLRDAFFVKMGEDANGYAVVDLDVTSGVNYLAAQESCSTSFAVKIEPKWDDVPKIGAVDGYIRRGFLLWWRA